MNAAASMRLAYIAFVGVTGIFLTSSLCLGFGGVSVGGISVSVGAGNSGVGVTVGTGGSGSGSGSGATGGGSAGASVSSGGVSVDSGGPAGNGVNVGVEGDSGGVEAHGGADVTRSDSGAQQGLARQRASLQMGMNPVQPDRGMAQALRDYYGKAPVSAAPAAADQALKSAVSDLPDLPSAVTAPARSVTDAAEPSGDSAERSAPDLAEVSITSPGAYAAAKSKALAASRQQTQAQRERTVAGAGAAVLAPQGTPPAISKADDPAAQFNIKKADNNQPSLASHVVRDSDGMTVLMIPPVQSLATSVIADPAATQPAPVTQFGQDPDIAGNFPDLKTSSLPTAGPILIVMLLSAAGAYGFVRLMSEKCPRCAVLLERHSAGCRNCGAQLRPANRPGLRMPV